MRDFVIMTDSCCDLTDQMARELELEVVPLSLHMGDHLYQNWLDGRDIPFEEFYARIRAGELATTSAVSVGEFEAVMRPILAQGKDILYIGFSSALSTTYQSAVIAADDLRAEFPDARIFVVDSLCASLGQGLLLYLCAQQKLRRGHLHRHAVLRGARQKVLRRAVVDLRHGAGRVRQHFTRDFLHTIRGDRAYDAQRHVRRVVKHLVAGVERLIRDLGDALHRARDGFADGVVRVQALHQVHVHGVVRVVLAHADLLSDDALLLFHALRREVRRCDKAQQRAEVFLKILRALKIVCGDVAGGEGVRLRAVRGERRERVVAVRHVEHLMLQKMRHARRRVDPLIAETEAAVAAAVVRGEHGKAAVILRLAQHAQAQPVRQRRAIERLADAGILFILHRHPPFP